ncbi:class I SAM-dependent methyltransferase [Virgisporangium aurantiacum]|uniref:Methyltransferase MycE N-terminal domain-containing protein n=1 Tax=Virgisporangium aurantiacum TaxID=175570 RepID=A0A8J4E3T7_9ACTN|nr:class I SAM-dependent methyltransferase [Virgisporangium aurantiacum]GIJ60384.1 hypothetical protein Vau01_079000 [Virgisporangium aurantiacum]
MTEDPRAGDAGHALIERLLAAADGTPDETADRLAGEDPDAVAVTTLAEVMTRVALDEVAGAPVAVQVDLGGPGGRLGYVVTVGDPAAKVAPGWIADPWVRLRQDLTEFVRAVFGPAVPPAGATRELFLKDEPGPRSWRPDDPWRVAQEAARRAAHRLVRACTAATPDLAGLAVRFGSDKWGGHWYTPHYERHFAPLRDHRVRLLELGIGGYHLPDQGGASLHMWQHYFPRGLVHGLDIYDKSRLPVGPRVRTVRGDQGDAAFLDTLGHRIGPLDIVIDDGSHLSRDVIVSFRALFPHLRDGGLYVIEDLGTAYWPGWGGSSERLDDPATSAGFLKTLVDGLNHQELVPGGGRAAADTDTTVTGLHLYHNLAVVEKGRNTEQPAPSWVSRTEDPGALL